MLRSLFSAVSGMRAHQTMMDVVGNNIANVNTVGFKSGNAVFEDTLSQVVRSGTAPGTDGGTNPAQVGLGVEVGAINQNFSEGQAQSTGRNLDFMIQGDGFFQTRQGEQTLYTRAGSLNTDAAGNLVTPDGNILQGWTATNGTVNNTGAPADLKIPIGSTNANGATLTAFTLDRDGTIQGVYSDDSRQAIGQLALATFTNPGGLEKMGETSFRTGIDSGAAQVGAPTTGTRGSVVSGALEMSNVDLADEFSHLIIAQRGFQANSRVITASDEVLQDLVNIKR